MTQPKKRQNTYRQNVVKRTDLVWLFRGRNVPKINKIHKFAKMDPRDVPRSKRHPQGTQKAPKTLPGTLPRNLTKSHLNYSPPGPKKNGKRHPKSQKSAPTRHLLSIIFVQRIPTTFFVTFSRPPGCLDLLKHCACHAFRGISEILKFTFFNEKVL